MLFAYAVQLVCGYGKHRLKAGEAFGEDRWLVELYLAGKHTSEVKGTRSLIVIELPTDASAQLREKSSNAQNFKDGEIYRTLRQYQLLYNHV